MKEFWVEFNGWFKVEAEDKDKANDKAVEEIYSSIAHVLQDFNFEIDCIEEDD